MRDLIPLAQFKKLEKHPWRSVNFSKVAGWSRLFAVFVSLTITFFILKSINLLLIRFTVFIKASKYLSTWLFLCQKLNNLLILLTYLLWYRKIPTASWFYALKIEMYVLPEHDLPWVWGFEILFSNTLINFCWTLQWFFVMFELIFSLYLNCSAVF